MKTLFKKAIKFCQKKYLGFRTWLIRDICLGGLARGLSEGLCPDTIWFAPYILSPPELIELLK